LKQLNFKKLSESKTDLPLSSNKNVL